MLKIKNVAKSLFAILIVAAIALGSILNVQAVIKSIELGSAGRTGKYIAGVDFDYKVTKDNVYLYCTNMNKKTARNVTANLVENSPNVDGGLYYILKNGYPQKSITGDSDKDYYITQTAVWWYLDETRGTQNLGEQFKVAGSDSYNMRHYVKELVQAGINHRNDSTSLVNTTASITALQSNMTLEGEYYVAKVSIKTSNAEKISITFEGAPTGTFQETTEVTGTEKVITVKVPAANVPVGNQSFKVKLKATGAVQTIVSEYNPTDPDMQTVAMLYTYRDNCSVYTTLNIPAATTVSVTKVDKDTGKSISGAQLAIFDVTGNMVARWESSTNAHIIRNLPNGKYTLKEEKAPEGYLLNKEVKTFEITDSNRNIKLTFENKAKKVVVNITKVDQETKQPLSGATMAIKDSTGEIVYKYISSNHAEVLTDLENGTYTIVEIAAPEGYIKSDQIITFTIDDEHLSHQFEFANARAVEVPDTASASSIIMVILGLAITGLGINYIYKNGKKA